MRILRAAASAALFIFLLPLAAAAQDVTLTSHDRAVEVIGTLLSYDGEFYRVDSQFGVLTVDGSGVICGGPGCPNLENYVAELSVVGAPAVGEVLLPALLEGFARSRDLRLRKVIQDDRNFIYELRDPIGDTLLARFGFQLSTASDGFARLIEGDADIVLSDREVLAEERAAAKAAGLGDLGQANRSRIVALDGLVVLVAPGNPIADITLPQLSAILRAEVTNWEALGGAEAPILLHLPAATTGLGQGVAQKILDDPGAVLRADAIRHDSAAVLADAVARDPFAIGIGRFSETGNAEMLALGGACGFPFHVSHLTLKSEDYPLANPMFLYTPAKRLPKPAREFLSFLRSPMAQRIVDQAGFVDQAPVEVALDAQGDRIANAIAAAGEETSLAALQQMVAELRSFSRLSVTFRFEAGSSNLDAQSRENVAALAEALEQGVFDGREVLFVGFSDGDGGAEANLRIARKRANAARLAVLQAAPAADLSQSTLTAQGYGEAMPMACDDAEWGRRVNRRVEVWVR